MLPMQQSSSRRLRYDGPRKSLPLPARLAVQELDFSGGGGFLPGVPGGRPAVAGRTPLRRARTEVSLPPVPTSPGQASPSSSPVPAQQLHTSQSLPSMPTLGQMARIEEEVGEPAAPRQSVLASGIAAAAARQGWKAKGPGAQAGGPRASVRVASFDASKLLGGDKGVRFAKAPRGPSSPAPRALACALVERCGSLEGAWWQLGGGAGRLSSAQWAQGIIQLGLDIQQVCGVSAQDMFWRLKSYSGDITPDSWQEFFKPCRETPEAMDALNEAARQHELQAKPGRQVSVTKQRKNRGGLGRRRTSSSGASEGAADGDQTPSASSQSQGPESPPARRASGSFQPMPSISEALANEAKMSKKELAELDAQGAAEQAVLEEEIASLNLTGIEALAYVLTAKLGSVKKAFQWFDMTQSGRVANVEFDTGVRLLRIDLERLTGVEKRTIWRSMDRSSQGLLKKSDWREFFREALNKIPADALKRLQQSKDGTLAERAKKMRSQAEGEGSPDGRGKGRTDGSDAGSAVAGRSQSDAGDAARGGRARRGSRGSGGKSSLEDGGGASGGLTGTFADLLGPLSEEELSFLERVRKELSQLPDGERAEYPPEGAADGLDSRHSLIVQGVAAELGLFAHALDVDPDSAPPPRRGTQYAGGPWHKQGAVEPQEGSCIVLVFNLKDFVERVRSQLEGLPLGERLEFSAELTAVQRQVVHLLASSLGLWTQSEGQGSSRRVIAFNLGNLADDIRRQLQALTPGESVAFPRDFTEVQRKMVHMIASELMLWSYSIGEGEERYVEVINLREFAEQVRAQLSQLGPGEHRTYPPSLSEKHRKVVHCIAEELGLQHLAVGEGSERCVVVGNLHGFHASVRSDLEALAPGETKDYEPSLSVLERKTVHVIAGEVGCESRSRGQGQARYVSVTRPGEGGMTRVRSVTKDGAESDAGGDENMTEESKIASLFDCFATGNYNGKRVFIGFRDLANFADELREAMPVQHRRFRRLREDLGQVFEDTLQLQIDFGTRTKKGLTLQWFKVFIQKAARQVGLSVMGMLIAILGNAAVA